jgi:ArsR family transcriptional regulator
MNKTIININELLACANMFRTCAHPVRLKIIGLLQKKPLYVNEIMFGVKLPQAETSHHLRLLLKTGVLRNDRKGKRVYYSIIPGKIERINKALDMLAT